MVKQMYYVCMVPYIRIIELRYVDLFYFMYIQYKFNL